jgi:hypothetical protein
MDNIFEKDLNDDIKEGKKKTWAELQNRWEFTASIKRKHKPLYKKYNIYINLCQEYNKKSHKNITKVRFAI